MVALFPASYSLLSGSRRVTGPQLDQSSLTPRVHSLPPSHASDLKPSSNYSNCRYVRCFCFPFCTTPSTPLLCLSAGKSLGLVGYFYLLGLFHFLEYYLLIQETVSISRSASVCLIADRLRSLSLWGGFYLLRMAKVSYCTSASVPLYS